MQKSFADSKVRIEALNQLSPADVLSAHAATLQRWEKEGRFIHPILRTLVAGKASAPPEASTALHDENDPPPAYGSWAY